MTGTNDQLFGWQKLVGFFFLTLMQAGTKLRPSVQVHILPPAMVNAPVGTLSNSTSAIALCTHHQCIVHEQKGG